MSRIERMLRTIYDVRFLLAVVIVILLIAILVPIRQNRVTNNSLKRTVETTRQTQLANADTNARIKDCVDPHGKCYQDSQKRTAQILAQFQRITVFANACAVIVTKDDTIRDQEEILAKVDACIKKSLQEEGTR